MYFVYIIRSLVHRNRFYVGYTLDIQARLDMHNAGRSIYTHEHRPWELAFSCKFNEKAKALDFERYLKTHSGRAFMEKRLT